MNKSGKPNDIAWHGKMWQGDEKVCLNCIQLSGRRILALIVTTLGLTSWACADNRTQPPFLSLSDNGRLVYQTDQRGNRIPDFSHCGYMGGNQPIPDVPIRVVVHPIEGDNTERIQVALDYVASLPADTKGIRGAVLLRRGRYEIFGSLKMLASGVVLRGEGMDEEGTVLIAAGTDRRTLIRIAGKNDLTDSPSEARQIVDECVPVGACSFHLNTTEGLKVGDTVNIIRPSTKQWIDRLGMNSFGGGLGGVFAWKPDSRNLVWDRVIKSVTGNLIVVDAPITTAIEAQFGGGWVQPYSWPGRISHVGVENLRCESDVDQRNPKDEAHSWMAVTMENIENAWVRQVTMMHFAGSAVAIWETCKKVTVQNCASLAPVSENGGYRRHSFFTMGQLTLFLHCWAEQGRHDFSVGHCAAGPNAFVQCEAGLPLDDTGPIESWASGTLYDNVNIEGNALRLCNRGSKGQGIGWAAANSVLWQCSAAIVQCENPPTAGNWAFGSWGEFESDGIWRDSNNFVKPISLYGKQLADRLGDEAAQRLQIRHLSTVSATRPTVQEAAKFTADSHKPATQLADYIAEAANHHAIPTDPGDAPSLDEVFTKHSNLRSQNTSLINPHKVTLTNGWLTCDGHLLTGGRGGVAWWRGNVRPPEAPKFGSGVTRFVPGRIGPGFTDNLNELTDTMVSSGEPVLDYNYGLWYDRRRDDHQRVRRMNGDVEPPFYELPFARSGRGTAWDGLSKYDLTKYNPWYWSRLKQFADLCDRKGLVLLHQNYFQHNILEAGAHWADFPWRSANNINHTGFPEPPSYAGNKRIFMDELFYDVNHPVRRSLHRAYIRKCLENFIDNSNVVQLTSAEFTGPLEFVRFWLDTIMDWERETGHKPLIGLSCTKDVQDAILADPVRGGAVSVIDIRYWWYQAGGKLYAPEGGKHLAPRQHARLQNPRRTSFSQVVRAIRDYRNKYPDKAVLYSADAEFGWAVLMGGGSIPDLRNLTNRALLAAIPRMRPLDLPVGAAEQYALAEPGRSYLIYAASGEQIQIDLTEAKGTFIPRWLDLKSGEVASISDPVAGGEKVELTIKFKPCVLWLVQ
ncbi:MAG: DUF6298 domain-containing protein [Planctomycetota bacterium]|jgi:hypothetical protein